RRGSWPRTRQGHRGKNKGHRCVWDALLLLLTFRRYAPTGSFGFCVLCSFLCALDGRAARGPEARRALDDRREHRARVAAFGRPIRLPDRRIVLCEDILEVPVALDALRREL